MLRKDVKKSRVICHPREHLFTLASLSILCKGRCCPITPRLPSTQKPKHNHCLCFVVILPHCIYTDTKSDFFVSLHTQRTACNLSCSRKKFIWLFITFFVALTSCVVQKNWTFLSLSGHYLGLSLVLWQLLVTFLKAPEELVIFPQALVFELGYRPGHLWRKNVMDGSLMQVNYHCLFSYLDQP